MPMPKPVCRTFLNNKWVQCEVCITFLGRGMGMNITAQYQSLAAGGGPGASRQARRGGGAAPGREVLRAPPCRRSPRAPLGGPRTVWPRLEPISFLLLSLLFRFLCAFSATCLRMCTWHACVCVLSGVPWLSLTLLPAPSHSGGFGQQNDCSVPCLVPYRVQSAFKRSIWMNGPSPSKV